MNWSNTINISFCLLNAENLFLLFDHTLPADWQKMEELQWQKLSTSVYDNKSLKKCFALAKSIQDLNPDILMLCEVGGTESLKNFNELFLNNLYSVAMTEGNSDRNIDVAFLIKKNSPFYFDLHTNKNRLLNFWYPHEKIYNEEAQKKNIKLIPSHKFSRDCVELRLFKISQDKPFAVILLTHLKSRLDKEHIDPNGFERRSAELQSTIEIYKELQTQHPLVPILICGDFNGIAAKTNTDLEFKEIYTETDWGDVLELSNVNPQDRWTYAQVKATSRTEGRQIDYCFLNSVALKYLNKSRSLVYRYKDQFGFALDQPQSLEAKFQLPSDHYPIYFELININTQIK